MDHIKVRIF